ncbi:unnamed protein product [Rotaria sordida]|uniref:Uncharacterized protein n=1 Tax=Rotaria sordida TaxID=392033 RepID=A0A815IPF6_9BILA|nr:unnamed protein product [Rotaria sordida]
MQQHQWFAQTNVDKLAMNNGVHNEKLLVDTCKPVRPGRDDENSLQEELVHHRQVPTTFSSSIFASNENQNKEETTLIWCDKNIDIHDDTKKTAELLQKVNDYVLICSNLDTCQSADEMIDKIHDHKQVDSIYIFCINNIKYEHYLNEDHEKYYKLVGIYTEHEPLLKAIQENIRYFLS